MELWVLITIAAAVFQTCRNTLQKNLKLDLGTNAISYARFVFGLPWAIAYILTLTYFFDFDIPETHIKFWLLCLIAGISQIIATSLLVYLFSFKNFMVGTTYAKTEAIQAVILGALLFHESFNILGVISVIIGLFGILIISSSKNRFSLFSLIKDVTHKTALIGLGSGLFFALASLCLRDASLSLSSSHFLISASMTLVCVLLLQSVLFGFYMIVRERNDLIKMFRRYKITAIVGFSGVLGSACWFTAMTLTAVAYVKTVGQIEIIFTILISLFFFKEKIKLNEYVGMGLIIVSILLLMYKA